MYARIHILGIADMACILALLVLGEFLLAAAYFVLTPFNSHAIANAYYYGEEK
jgi:energy-converting hydrogenase B subunit C